MKFQVHDKYIDFAIGGISQTFERSLLVEYTTVIHFEPYGVIYSSNSEEFLKWKTFILPIDLYVWIFFIGSFIAVAVALKFVHKFAIESDPHDYISVR